MNVNNIEVDNANNNLLTKKHMVLIVLLYVSLMLIMLFFINSIIGVNKVISGSMQNTLVTNDYYLRNKIAFKFNKNPKRGQVIDFNSSEGLYVKRVIGLPNETIFLKDGIVYVDNEPLEENYTINIDYSDYGQYVVPEDEYFVLGDNRLESNDSRFWEYSFVKKKDITGKVLFRINLKKFIFEKVK